MTTTTTTTTAPRSVLTTAEACEELAIARLHFYDLIHSGRLRAMRIGRGFRVTRAALDEFLENESKRQAAGGA